MIPAESAHDTIGALGDVGLLQFKDLNADKSAFQRTYANQVCELLVMVAHFTISSHSCKIVPAGQAL
jgi:hypothetical protein